MNYQSHYDRLVEKHGLKKKPDFYVERHHILPKCLGGSDEESNLVYLKADAHFVAHQLLVKINPDHYGVSYAAIMMTRTTSQQVRSNKLYSWLKEQFSKVCSEFQKNRFSDKVNHPCFGKFGSDHPRYGTGKHQKSENYKRSKPKPRGSPEYFEMMSSIRKEAFKGEKNPSYGTRMINNGVIRKRIGKHQDVPHGWVLGAKFN